MNTHTNIRRRRKRFEARVQYQRQRLSLGMFSTRIEAEKALAPIAEAIEAGRPPQEIHALVRSCRPTGFTGVVRTSAGRQAFRDGRRVPLADFLEKR